jgi:hypothetical protein
MFYKYWLPNVYLPKQNTPAAKKNDQKNNDDCGKTPDNPWIVDTDRAPSSDIDICPTSVGKLLAKAKRNNADTVGKDEDVMSGKRKRSIPKKFKSPYALEKRSRRPNRGTRTSSKIGTVINFRMMLDTTNAWNNLRRFLWLFMQLWISIMKGRL